MASDRLAEYITLERAVASARRRVGAARSALNAAQDDYEHAVSALSTWAAVLVTRRPEREAGDG